MNNQTISQKIARRLSKRLIVSLLIYTMILAIIFTLAIIIRVSANWLAGPFYSIFHFLYNMALESFLLLWLIGSAIIFFRHWQKMTGYLESIIEANSLLYSSSIDMIHLPTELLEFETELNQIKNKFLQNQNIAKEAEQRKNDLVVYLAHDLKTPLTSVLGYLNLLQDEKNISPELQSKYLSIALEKAVRLEDLINEFFEITRFNLTRLVLEVERINLTRVIEQITFEFNPILKEKSLTYQLDLEKDVQIMGDADKIQRVLDNLIRNAVNYSFVGGEIYIRLSRVDDGVEIVIQNDGNTISEEKLSRIFEQFYRLDSARTSGTGGAGLGLAIAKEIVEAHHGKITAKSNHEVITFEVYLPTII